MYQDSNGIFFGRESGENVEIFHVEDGLPATRLDAIVYPIGSDMSAMYEHPEGIVLSKNDAKKIGVEVENGR